MIGRTNSGTGGGGGGKGLPEFTYTGTYTVIDDGNDNWRIKFTSNGTLRFTKLKGAKNGIDVFLVGGGGGARSAGLGGGGGGGYTRTVGNVTVSQDFDYSVVVGDGGSRNSAGHASSAFNYSASGGVGSTGENGANGGSGGGGAGSNANGGVGGSDGGNGGKGTVTAGTGQGTSTREFWLLDQNTNATLYAGGGGGGSYRATGGAGGSGGGGKGGSSSGVSGTANTGGGGGGANSANASGVGGSGIVVIRNVRT